MFNPVQSRTLAVSGDALPVWGSHPILTPFCMTGTEKLGKLFTYRLELATTNNPTLPVYEAQARIQPDRLVGTQVTITVEFEGKGEFVAGVIGGGGLGQIGKGKRTVTGLITAVQRTGSDDRQAFYQFTVRPWLWLATRNRENRIFQNQSVIDITDAVLGSKLYPFVYEKRISASGLRGVYPKRDYVRQYWESDYDFLTRLWREWGLYFFMEGSTLVLCDSPCAHHPHGNMYDTIRYHARDGARIDEEHIHTLKVTRALTAGVVSHVDYDATQSRGNRLVTKDDSRDEPFANAEHYDWGSHSQPLAGAMGLSGQPNDWQAEGEYLARVRVDAMRCRRLRLKGQGNLRGLATGHTFHLEGYPDHQVNAEYLVIATSLDIRNVAETSQPVGSGSDYQCVTDFVLQPVNTFFCNRPRKKPQCGPETAVVVGPDQQPMWTDGYARAKVQFIWDRLGQGNENSSCWVRVNSPWQGNGFGAIFLPRIGQEVTIHYHEGDPDRPYVSSRMVNQFNQPPWKLPDNQALSGIRSRGLDGVQANQIVTDDTPGKLQVQVSSDHAQSRLVLGYNTRIDGNAGRKEARGIGWELATDAHGVLRANRGMLVTTETRAGASAPAKAMGETVQRLTQAREQHEDLSRLAQRHHAQDAEISQGDATTAMKTQNDALRGTAGSDDNPFPEMTRADMAIASAAGFAVTATESMHLASQQDHAVTAGRDVSISGGRSLFAAVRGAVSFFAAQFGIRLFAGKGKVEIQAHSDDIEPVADQVLKLISSKKRIEITAAEEILLQARGSYIRINGAGIEQGTPARWVAYAANHALPGPKSLPVSIPGMDMPKAFSNRLDVYDIYWPRSFEEVEYAARRASGEVIAQGVLDQDGRTQRFSTDQSETLEVLVGTRGAWLVESEGGDGAEQHDGSGDELPDDPNHYVHHSA
ncbi:type VI secretion system Vgr family protein [Burkholderia sp. LMG 32019]|uniref:type VI secretion system Vgr family protein n=1 Tax=Burkholderia sp. LMG 32019 TaxID=3158173 RepID=UPI003C2F14B5